MSGVKKIGPGAYTYRIYLLIKTVDMVRRHKKLKNGSYSIRPYFKKVTYWSLYRKNIMSRPVYRGRTIKDCVAAVSAS